MGCMYFRKGFSFFFFLFLFGVNNSYAKAVVK